MVSLRLKGLQTLTLVNISWKNDSDYCKKICWLETDHCHDDGDHHHCLKVAGIGLTRLSRCTDV